MPSIWLVVIFSVLVVTTVSSSDPIVRIKQGTLKGFTDVSRNGNVSYFGFLGIPYATPPVNELRFQAPRPHPGWSGKRNATQEGSICPQPHAGWFPGNMDEDCLNLNVYSPKIDPSAKLPVLFLIHGGGFIVGGAKFYKEKYLMDENVVYVSINYRLGVLGFMSFADEVVPGNFGLKDQLMALQWVQDNIEQFGGDASKVTIFGFSAGGASVDFHVISPMSKGMFRSAIVQSGTSFCPWAVTPQTVARQRAEAVATLLGCPSKPTLEALACLRGVSAQSLVTVSTKFEQWDGSPPVSFSPVIDSSLGAHSFLPDFPWNLSPNKVSVIMGINKHDGSITVTQMCQNQLKLGKQLEADLSRKLPVVMNIQDHVENKDKKKVSEDLMRFYLKDQNITEETVGEEFSELATDLLFSHCSYKAAQHYYKQIPVYFFLFDIKVPSSPFSKIFGSCAHVKGPGHGDENYYLFNDVGSEAVAMTPVPSALEIHGPTLLDLWTNFTRTGVPSDVWAPVSSDQIEYLHIASDGNSMKNAFLESRMKFLNTLPLLVNQL